MVVLHVTPCLAPAWACGVAADRVARLAQAQASAGDRVLVLTTDASAPHERLPAGPQVLRGVRIVRVRTLNSSTRWSIGFTLPRGIRRAAREIVEREGIDVVHLHELRTIENLRVVPLVGNQPIVLSLHDSARPLRSAGTLLRAWDRRVGRRVLGRVSCVIADGTADADAAANAWRAGRLELAHERIAIVPPPRAAANAAPGEMVPDEWTLYAERVRRIYAREVAGS
jgi:hypothetical protein